MMIHGVQALHSYSFHPSRPRLQIEALLIFDWFFEAAPPEILSIFSNKHWISFWDQFYLINIDIKLNLISWDRTYLFLLQLYTIFSISIQRILSGRGLIVTFNVIDKRRPWQTMFILDFAHSCFYTFECWVGADDNRWPIFVVTQVLKFHVWRMICWCSIKLFLVRWMKSYLVCTICICCVCR